MTVAELPMYVLQAQKRAVRRPAGVPLRKDGSLSGWESDEEGFLERWPDNLRPDIGVQRSQDARKLIDQAKSLNEAQLRSGFLDWLFVVDVDAPVHVCTEGCPTHPETGGAS